ncbi:hypothetical protein Hanom_Chr15g01365511 [Helianthus anomalus]
MCNDLQTSSTVFVFFKDKGYSLQYSVNIKDDFCHHADRVVKFQGDRDCADSYIVGLCPPVPPIEPGESGDMALDVSLLERVFSLPMKTVKSIPYSCRMAFAQALSLSLRGVLAHPHSI